MREKNNTYNFVLVLSGVSEPDARLEDALFEAGCDDAILSFRNAVAYLEFDRRARSLEDAIISAVQDVERADARITVVRVEPGDLVNASEIGRRIQLIREYVRLLAQGKRGEGDFPAPQSGITGKTLVWSWAEVVRWLSQHDMIEDKSLVDAAVTIRDINDALDVRDATRTRALQSGVHGKCFLPRQTGASECTRALVGTRRRLGGHPGRCPDGEAQPARIPTFCGDQDPTKEPR